MNPNLPCTQQVVRGILSKCSMALPFALVLLGAGCATPNEGLQEGWEAFRRAANTQAADLDLGEWAAPPSGDRKGQEDLARGATFQAMMLAEQSHRVIASLQQGDQGVIVLETSPQPGGEPGQTASILLEQTDRWRIKAVSRPGAVVPELWSNNSRPAGEMSAKVRGAQGSWQAKLAYGFMDRKSHALELVLLDAPVSSDLLDTIRVGRRAIQHPRMAVATFQNSGSSFQLDAGPISSMCVNLPGAGRGELTTHCQSIDPDAIQLLGDVRSGTARLTGAVVPSQTSSALEGAITFDAPVFEIQRY